MNEVFDHGKTKADDSTRTGGTQMIDPDDNEQKSRSQVVKTKIIREVVTKEESAAHDATESILFVVVCVLSLIIVILLVYCICKRFRKTKPLVVAVPAQQTNQVNSDENTSFEEKPQYNAHKNMDHLAIGGSKKRTNKAIKKS